MHLATSITSSSSSDILKCQTRMYTRSCTLLYRHRLDPSPYDVMSRTWSMLMTLPFLSNPQAQLQNVYRHSSRLPLPLACRSLGQRPRSKTLVSTLFFLTRDMHPLKCAKKALCRFLIIGCGKTSFFDVSRSVLEGTSHQNRR